MAGEAFSPSHYTRGAVETIDKIEAAVAAAYGPDGVRGFLLGSALKYFDRAGSKDGASAETDMDKCRNYMHRLENGEWLDD